MPSFPPSRRAFLSRTLVPLLALPALGRSAVPGALEPLTETRAPSVTSGTPGMPVWITDLGARPGTEEVCTAIIQRAIDHCHGQGGGTVVIPPGVFTTGTLRLRSFVCIDLAPGAVLRGSLALSDYPVQPTPAYRSLKDSAGFRALIYAEGEERIAVVGQGTLDGRGEAFPFGGNDLDGRPRLLQFVSCKGVRVEGLRLRNSALWMQHYLNCEQVQVRGLEVWNHANRNNDMIDIDGCRQVTVSDCVGDTDDDGITLKSTGPAPCENVVITNCVISSRCNAIKCGTESTGGFRNVAISNCVVKPTVATTGFYGFPEGICGIALEIVDGGRLEGVVISNVTIEGTRVPFFIRLGNRARRHHPDAPKPGLGVLRDVLIQNVLVRGAGALGSSITGLPGHRVEQVRMNGVTVHLAQPGEAADVGRTVEERERDYPEASMWGRLPACGFYVRHASQIRFRDVVVVPAAGEPRPLLVTDDVVRSPDLACEAPPPADA
ncbi:MAG: glycosyl hydrolase family 28 protein [Opitutaceae bacterium]